MLDVRGVHAGYAQTRVLDGIDLRVDEGELVVLIGPNGHGKTTLLRAISGLVRITAGEIRFAGERIDVCRAEQIARRGLVHVPQGDLLFVDSTVEENLLLGAFSADAWRRRSEALRRVYALFPRLEERRRQRARTLSGGERRMLALGRGLMTNARMLMLDEPALGLAPVLVDEVYATIAEIARGGVTLLLVEENFSHVESLAERVYLIETGRIVREGSIEDVMADEALMTAYLGA